MKETIPKRSITKPVHLTQEELLEEAKRTEQLNLDHLRQMQQMELQKKSNIKRANKAYPFRKNN